MVQASKVNRAQSMKLEQRPILAKKGTKNFITPHSIIFLSVLHQNKALLNFHKRGQRPIARHIKGLD